MSDIIKIGGVRGYVDKDGMAWLNAEDVARGFGFVQKQTKNGKTYTSIRWERVNDYLAEFGFRQDVGEEIGKDCLPPQVGENDFLPENMVYRLGFKASNEVAQGFQAKLADEILPTIRKTGSYSVNQAPAIDTAKQMRAEATLMNAQTRKAQLIWKIAKDSDNGLYRQAGEALAMNILAGKMVVVPPQDEQKPNHELGHFCQFIDKPETWATQLGKVLKRNGIEKTAETGVWRVIWDKKNNQRKSFYWFDSYLMPILVKLFPKDEVEDAETD
jgi:prophage antirepressor-like protein